MRKRTLIPPVPKEYISYSEQEKIEKTERYYKKLSELYLRIDRLEEEYKKRVDLHLEMQMEVKDLLAMMNEEEAQILCHYTYEFALLKLFCQIAVMEEDFHELSVLQEAVSLKDVVDRYRKSIFLIRRFELDWEADSELLDLVRQRKISYIYLAELILADEIIQKIHAGCRIAEYLYTNGCKREALLFIMMLEKKLPYSEGKVENFTVTLIDIGEQQLAYEVIMKHQNPNEDIKQLQAALSKRM